jgi:hypothetical protein
MSKHTYKGYTIAKSLSGGWTTDVIGHLTSHPTRQDARDWISMYLDLKAEGFADSDINAVVWS